VVVQSVVSNYNTSFYSFVSREAHDFVPAERKRCQPLPVLDSRPALG